MWLKNNCTDLYGNDKLFFEEFLTNYHHCSLKQLCMKNSDAMQTHRYHGRQVSFIIKQKLLYYGK